MFKRNQTDQIISVSSVHNRLIETVFTYSTWCFLSWFFPNFTNYLGLWELTWNLREIRWDESFRFELWRESQRELFIRLRASKLRGSEGAVVPHGGEECGDWGEPRRRGHETFCILVWLRGESRESEGRGLLCQLVKNEECVSVCRDLTTRVRDLRVTELGWGVMGKWELGIFVWYIYILHNYYLGIRKYILIGYSVGSVCRKTNQFSTSPNWFSRTDGHNRFSRSSLS